MTCFAGPLGLLHLEMNRSSLNQELSKDAYNEERLRPQFGQKLYLHLSDLRMAMDQVASPASFRLLDYGCGGSPYRKLFPNAQYKRADFLDCGGLDYKLAEDSRVPEKDSTFEFILSTQVLEHVTNPAVYLAECHRLLEPGGEMVLTTHGVFEDHGCPYDFYRWTADGLQKTLQANGFQVVRLEKLTTGPRAIIFLMEQFHRSLDASRKTFFGLFLWFIRKTIHRYNNYVHPHCDKAFASNRVVDANLPGQPLYIGLFAVCKKAGQ